jgi:hypothetical protein
MFTPLQPKSQLALVIAVIILVDNAAADAAVAAYANTRFF